MSAMHLVFLSSLALATSPTVRYAGTPDAATDRRRPAAPAGQEAAASVGTEDVGFGPPHGSPPAAIAGGDVRAPPRQPVDFKRTSLCVNCEALFDITAVVASSGRDLPRHADYLVSLADVANSQFRATHDLGPFICDHAKGDDDATATCASTLQLFVPFPSLGDTLPGGKRDAVVLTSLIRRDLPDGSKVVDQGLVAVANPYGNHGVSRHGHADDRSHSSRYIVTLRDEWPTPLQSAINDSDAAFATIGAVKTSSGRPVAIGCAVGSLVGVAIVLVALIYRKLHVSRNDHQCEHHAPKKENATNRVTGFPSPRDLFTHFSESACSPDVRNTRRDSHDAMSSMEGEGIYLGSGAVNKSSPNSTDRGGDDTVAESSASPRSPWTSGDEDGGRGTASSELEIYVDSPKSVDEEDENVANPLPCSNTLSSASEPDESYSNDAKETDGINDAHTQDSRKAGEPSMLTENGANLSSTSIEGQDEDPLPNPIRPKIDGEDIVDEDYNKDANGGKYQRLDSPNMPISNTVRSFNSASTDQIANRGSLPAPLESNCEFASGSSTGECKDNECLADRRLKARVSTSPIDRRQLRSSPGIQIRTNQCRGSQVDEKSALNPTLTFGDFGEPNDDRFSQNQRTSPSKLRKSPEGGEPAARSPSDNFDSPDSRSGSQRPIDRSKEASASSFSPASTAAATVGEFAGESPARDRPVPIRCGVNGQKRLGVSPKEVHVSTTGLSENPPSPALSSSDLHKKHRKHRKHRKQRKIEKQLGRTLKADGKHKDPEALARLSQNISMPAWEYNAKPSREQSY